MLLAFILGAPVMAAQNSSPDRAGEELGLTNAVCPVTPAETVDPSFFAEYNGKRVYFCCKRCKLRFEQDPDAYVEALAEVMPVGLQSEPSQSAAGGHDHTDADEHGSHDDATSSANEPEHGHAESGESAPDGHDHATDHGVSPLAFIGRLHVVAVHFPIAFLLLGAMVEGAGLVRKQWKVQPMVRLLTAVGALSALAAMGLGLLHGSADDYAGTLSWVFWWHRALGIAVSTAAVIAWIAVERRARREKSGGFATVALLLTAALVGITGHFGGSLVYGWEYLLP